MLTLSVRHNRKHLQWKTAEPTHLGHGHEAEGGAVSSVVDRIYSPGNLRIIIALVYATGSATTDNFCSIISWQAFSLDGTVDITVSFDAFSYNRVSR